MNLQSELGFGEDGSNEGYTRWLLGRKVATEILARKMGLPLGHEVEVWLIGGLRLRGKLRFRRKLCLSKRNAFVTWDFKLARSPSLTAKWNRACGWINARPTSRGSQSTDYQLLIICPLEQTFTMV